MIFPQLDTDHLFFSRSDTDELFGTYSDHGFTLEDKDWKTVEHYFQASKFTDEAYREKIRQAATPALARKLGRRFWQRPRKDWKNIRETIMTRGLYMKCQSHPEIAAKLLETGSQPLIESSQYDYFWGCGRDRRGTNRYGRILMNIRSKLLEQREQSR